MKAEELNRKANEALAYGLTSFWATFDIQTKETACLGEFCCHFPWDGKLACHLPEIKQRLRHDGFTFRFIPGYLVVEW